MSPEDEGAVWERYRQQLRESQNRKANYNTLRNFCDRTAGTAKTNLEKCYDSLEELYKKHVVKFENTDDDYRNKAGEVYDACTSFGERWWDNIVRETKFFLDIHRGTAKAAIDFISGIWGLTLMLVKIEAALMLAVVTMPFGITPQWVKDTGKEAMELVLGIAQILKNPGRALAALGQKATDTVEEKGIPYAVSYAIADITIAILVDKGIKKLRGLDKADDLGDAAKVAEELGEAAEEFSDSAKVLDKMDDVEKVADEISDVAKIKILSSEEAEELAFNAIKGPDKADSVVLGRYETLKDKFGNDILDAAGKKIPTENSYNVIAKNMDAQYFELNNWDELAGAYNIDDMWKINEKFLDIQIGSGREIYLTTNPVDYIKGSTSYSKELRYLQEHGYRFIKEGDLWHAIQ